MRMCKHSMNVNNWLNSSIVGHIVDDYEIIYLWTSLSEVTSCSFNWDVML